MSICPSCMYSPRRVLRDLRCALTCASGTSESACARSAEHVFETKTAMGGPTRSRVALDLADLTASLTRSWKRTRTSFDCTVSPTCQCESRFGTVKSSVHRDDPLS